MKPTDSNNKKLRSFLGKVVMIKAYDVTRRSYGSPEVIILHYGMLISFSWTKESSGFVDGYVVLDHNREIQVSDILDIFPATQIGKAIYGD